MPPLPVDRAGEPPPSWADRRLWDVVPVRDAVLAVGLFVLIVVGSLAGYTLRGVLGPVLLALLIAFLFNPLLERARGRGVPRAVSAGLLALAIVGAELVMVLWVGPLVIRQGVALTREVPALIEQLSDRVEAQYGVDTTRFTRPIEDLTDGPAALDVEASMRLLQWALGGTDEVAATIIGAVGFAAYVAVTAILFPIYVFLISWHLPGLAAAANYIPRRRRAEVLRVLGLMNDVVAGFFRGRLVVSALFGVVLIAGWWLVGVPYAFVLGAATALLNVVPWASSLGLPLALGVTYGHAVTGGAFDWTWVLLWPTVVFFGAQGIDNWVLTPYIQSRAVNVSAVTVIITIFVGGALAGLPGMIIAVPLAACVKILGREVLLPRWRAWAERY
ncbi:MAG: AI-2E family transporter [Planctomycetes bacterium]|nr:AI-2E family transporter [Planctomycetota bacterium]